MVASVTFSPVTEASRIFRSRCNDSYVGKKFRRFQRLASGRETHGSEIFVPTSERTAAEALRNSAHPYESLDILPSSPSPIESPYKRLGGSRAQPLIRPNLKYTFHFSTVLSYPLLTIAMGVQLPSRVETSDRKNPPNILRNIARKRTIERRNVKEESERSRRSLLASWKLRPERGNKKVEDRWGAATPMRLDDLLATLVPRWYRRAMARVPLRFCVDAIRSFVRCFGISILIR